MNTSSAVRRRTGALRLHGPIARIVLSITALSLAAVAPVFAQDQTVNGNLSVTGHATVNSTLNVGAEANFGAMNAGNGITLSPTNKSLLIDADTGLGIVGFTRSGSTNARISAQGSFNLDLYSGPYGANDTAQIHLDRGAAGGGTGFIQFLTSNNAAASERMRIDSVGNVGIGTTTPTAKLDVAGDIKASGNLNVGGTFTAANLAASGGTLTGGTAGLTLNAGGTNQNIILNPSGSAKTTTAKDFAVTSTTVSTSSSTGALVISGGLGIGGVTNVAGTLNGGGLLQLNTSAGNIASLTDFTSRLNIFTTNGATQGIVLGDDTKGITLGNFKDGGSDNNFNLGAYAGGGATSFVALNVKMPTTGLADSVVRINGTVESTSGTTGSLVVAGGAAIAKNLNVGGTLSVTGNFSAANYAATGGAVNGGATGLTLNAGGTNQNITLAPSGTGATVFNGNVGIGTTTPTAKLQVVGDARLQGVVTTGSNTQVGAAISGDVVLPYGRSILYTNDAGNDAVRVMSYGAFGGDINALVIGNTSGNAWPKSLQFRVGGDYPTPPSERMRISNLGNLLIGTPSDSGNGRLQLADHTAASGGIGFGSDVALYRSSAGTLNVGGNLTVTGALSGGASGLAVNAGGSNQDITLTPSGNGNIYLNANGPGLGAKVFTKGGIRTTGGDLDLGPVNGNERMRIRRMNGGLWQMDFNAAGSDIDLAFGNSDHGALRLLTNNLERARFTADSGALLLGKPDDAGNGRLQLADHIAASGGIGFGTDVALYRSSAGTLNVGGNLNVSGTFSASNYAATSGSVTGGATGLALNAGGTNQNITLAPSGTGKTVLTGDAQATGAFTANAVSATTVSGGASGLALSAGGANQNITLTPSGTGATMITGKLGIGTANPTSPLTIYGGPMTQDSNPFIAFTGDDMYAGGLPHATIGLTVDSAAGGISAMEFAVPDPAAGGGSEFVFRTGNGDVRILQGATIEFGPDAFLRRGAAHSLATPGSLQVDGNLSVGGTFTAANFGGGAVTGSAAGLALNAGGTNQNITLTPTGTGATVFNGNVGIGITNPAARLAIAAPTTGELLDVRNTVANATDGSVRDVRYRLGLTAAVSNPADGSSNPNSALVFSSSITTQSDGSSIPGAYIFQNGNVGIGTTTPNAKLAIAAPEGTALIDIPAAAYQPGRTPVPVPGAYQLKLGAGAVVPGTSPIQIDNGALVFSSGLSSVGNSLSSPGAFVFETGSVLIGTAANLAPANNGKNKLLVDGAAAFGSGGTSKFLTVEFDSVADVGSIQARQYLGAMKALALNANGGNVGIGTSTPDAKLSVRTSAAEAALNLRPGTNSNVAYQVGFGPGAMDENLDPVQNGALIFNTALMDASLNPVQGAYIFQNGNVGIGTTTPPTAKLDVAGNANISGNLSVGGTFVAANFGGGAVTGGAAGLALNAGGTNQNITLTPSGTGMVNIGSGTSGVLKVFGTTASASPTTGALQVAGGVGVGGKAYFGDAADATSGGTGAVFIAGGLNVAKSLWIGAADGNGGYSLFLGDPNNYLQRNPSSGTTRVAGNGLDFVSPSAGGLGAFVQSSGDMANHYFRSNYGIRVAQSNASGPAWTTNGIQFQTGAASYKDLSTPSGATVPTTVFNSFARPALEAANTAVTTTDAATVYIDGAPVAGTNQTITNAWGLWNAGRSRFDRQVRIDSIESGPMAFTVINKPLFLPTAVPTNGPNQFPTMGGIFFGLGNAISAQQSINDTYIGPSVTGSLSSSTQPQLIYNAHNAGPGHSFRMGATEMVHIDTVGLRITPTTEATVGGAGSLTTAGGIFAAKKIVTNSDLIVAGNLSIGGTFSALNFNASSFTGSATSGLALDAGAADKNVTFLTAGTGGLSMQRATGPAWERLQSDTDRAFLELTGWGNATDGTLANGFYSGVILKARNNTVGNFTAIENDNQAGVPNARLNFVNLSHASDNSAGAIDVMVGAAGGTALARTARFDASGLALDSGAIAGGANGLNVFAGGTNKNITLSPSGSGITTTSRTVQIGVPVGTDALVLRDTTSNAPARFFFSNPVGTPPDLHIQADRIFLDGYAFRANQWEAPGGVIEAGTSSFRITNVADFSVQANEANTVIFRGGGSQTTTLRGYNNGAIWLNPDGGNVGIGTTAPAAKLDVNGAARIEATTASANKDTGALVVEGGAGIEGNVNAGGNLGIGGNAVIAGQTSTGTLAVTSDAAIGGQTATNTLTVANTATVNGLLTAANASVTNTLAAGSASIVNNLSAGGSVTAGNSVTSTSGVFNGGSANGLTLNAGGGTDKNVTLVPNADGSVVISNPGAAKVARLSFLNNQTSVANIDYVGSGATYTLFGSALNAAGWLVFDAKQIDKGIALSAAGAGKIVFGTNAQERGRFDDAGNFLLGKPGSSGNGRLQLADHTTASGGLGLGSDIAIYRSNPNELSLATGGTVRATINGNGIQAAADGTATTTAYSFGAATGTGMYRQSSGELAFATNGTQVVQASSATFQIPLPTTSTSSASGALVVTGGVGIGGDENVAGTLRVGTSQVTTIAGSNITTGTLSAGSVSASGSVTASTVSASGLISAGSVAASGAIVAGGAVTATDYVSTNGTVRGNGNGLTLNAGSSGQNLTLVTSGGGNIVAQGNFSAQSNATVLGNLGVGTSSPRSRLDVSGQIMTSAGGVLLSPAGVNGWAGWPDMYASAKPSLFIQNQDGTASTELFAAGNGAGADTVFSGTPVGGSLAAPSASPAGSKLQIRLGSYAGSTGGYASGATIDLENQAAHNATSRPTLLRFSTTDTSGTLTPRMIVMPNGFVGIGTTSPTALLAVRGTIRAQEVVVDNTNWSDYVFEENYHNKPLAEVEQYVKENKHLPGIPSAQDVKEKGVSVGQMQALLLAKVEELTLHLIEQEKRIKNLEAENAALRIQR